MKISSYYFLVELYIMFSTYGIENYGAADFNGFRNDVMDRHQGYLNKESALRQINVLAKSNLQYVTADGKTCYTSVKSLSKKS